MVGTKHPPSDRYQVIETGCKGSEEKYMPRAEKIAQEGLPRSTFCISECISCALIHLCPMYGGGGMYIYIGGL